MSETRNGGDTSIITREYFDNILVEMRHIDNAEPDISYTLYGKRFKTPVMYAALSHLGRVHPGGLTEAARGVHAAGAVMWAGMGEPEEMTDIVATGAPTINIIKPYADEREVLRRIENCERIGALAVGMDVDHQFGSRGERGSVLKIPMRPTSAAILAKYVKSTPLPFIVKGVLSTVDAQKCLDAGVRGIVVSHHHGMVDYAVPPLMVLPEIAKVINGAIPIFVDCGVERGLDVFKALALGASAVSVGRATMGPLGEKGADGVREKIEQINSELSWAMCVTHAKDLASIDKSVLHWKTERPF
ncbi:MAG: alpha-hydroxy-acid oxidizing protein [Oscillospiraceae bacterium]|jgi:isopentenyl diphosphate isomerase/L-lactate dehydrogenase-like FMN-dependent dehydrogenase|nr:alpha-hydroxy-acid oxidizing protein [Oscillospiraceae bacterium]